MKPPVQAVASNPNAVAFVSGQLPSASAASFVLTAPQTPYTSHRFPPMFPFPTVPVALDRAFQDLESDPSNSAQAIADLNTTLERVRQQQDTFGWQATIAECRRHPVCRLIHEDPLTRRAFERPRGYPGDPELLDIIYTRDWRGLMPEPTELGQAVFAHTIDRRVPSAVRARRDLLSRLIGNTCDRKRAPHILSVGCGHLRELLFSPEFLAGRVGRFVGLEQDVQCLEEVARSFPASTIETVPGSLQLLFNGTLAHESFDYIYSAGVFDRIDDSLAQRLTRRLFEMLRPGGRLLVDNFQPGLEDSGYMEAFMDWRIVYRDANALLRTSATVPERELTLRRTFTDATQSIQFLELERAA